LPDNDSQANKKALCLGARSKDDQAQPKAKCMIKASYKAYTTAICNTAVVSELIRCNELFRESSATPICGSIKAAAGSGTSHCGPVRTAVIAENASVGCWCPQKGTMCNRRAPTACKDTLLTARFLMRPLIPASFTCTGASGHRLIDCPAGGANQHLKRTASSSCNRQLLFCGASCR
jgi:hypothetical protein